MSSSSSSDQAVPIFLGIQISLELSGDPWGQPLEHNQRNIYDDDDDDDGNDYDDYCDGDGGDDDDNYYCDQCDDQTPIKKGINSVEKVDIGRYEENLLAVTTAPLGYFFGANM